MRVLGWCLLVGTCAVGVMLATPTPSSSHPSALPLGVGRSSAVEEVTHRRHSYAYRHHDRRYYRYGYYRPYYRPSYGDDDWPDDNGWPYYYRPHYYDPGWSRGYNATERLLQCLSAQPFVNCG